MAVIEIRGNEIRGNEIARCVCTALIECCPDEPFVIVEPGGPATPLTVGLAPCEDGLRIVAYGDSGGYPMELGRRTIPYGDGPRILLLGEGFCRQVADAAEEVLAMLTAVAGPFSRAWLLWAPDGSLASVIESERPVTRAHLEQRITADHDMPTGTLQPVPDAALPAVRAAWQRAVDQGQHITPDDIAKLTTQEA